jgi:phage tail-like protein
MIGDLLPGYRFLVTLDPTDAYVPASQALLVPLMVAAGFQEVAGIGAELEVMPYPEGGVNDYTHQLPVRHNWNRLTMKRGVVRDLGMWWWYQAGLTQSLGARRDGMIMMLTAAGTPAVGWIFRAGLAAKWTGPDLNAQEGAVAIESIEIAHQGITQVPLSPPGTP